MHTTTFEHRRVVMPVDSRRQPESRPVWFAIIIGVTVILGAVAWSIIRVAPIPLATPSATTAGNAMVVTSLGERQTHNGRYSAQVLATTPIVVGAAQSWTIHLAHRNRRLAHARLMVSAWMPESALPSPSQPSVHYVGRGNYRIENLTFSRDGWWNVALVINSRYGADSVAFNVILPVHP